MIIIPRFDALTIKVSTVYNFLIDFFILRLQIYNYFFNIKSLFLIYLIKLYINYLYL